MEEIKINNESFYNYLLDNGYYFDRKTIENYLLSLKVKPFAILTGNSGTGKTKLSQLFAKYLSEKKYDSEEEIKINNFDKEYFYVNSSVTRRSFGKGKKGQEEDAGWTLSNSDFKQVLPIDIIGNEKYGIKVGDIETTATISPVIHVFYDKKHNDFLEYYKDLFHKKGNSNSTVSLGINRGSIENLMNDYIKKEEITLESNINKTVIKDGHLLLNYNIFDYVPFSKEAVPCKLKVEEFCAEGKISIKFRIRWGKNNEISKYLEELRKSKKTFNLTIKDFNRDYESFVPKWDSTVVVSNKPKDCTPPLFNFDIVRNLYKIVPVGANWTENRNVIGYYNLITEEYQSTPAYELINQSKNNLKSPHFLILDEMNLSHVERYFADFLSAIESGENIPLYGIDKDLEIPNNLFIIGTVNVDETTYMFSPKVLDRANVLEFETYSSKDYMSGNINLNPPKGNISYLENPLSDSDIRNLGINELKELFKDVKVQNNNFWDLLTDEIFKFQSILKKSGFDFGFRVINEIVRFMYVAWKYEEEPIEWTNWERYFDAQIKQKLLPKLHGSEKILGDTLMDLANACESNDGIRYYTSAKKLKEMINVLDKQRYVSFIN